VGGCGGCGDCCSSGDGSGGGGHSDGNNLCHYDDKDGIVSAYTKFQNAFPLQIGVTQT
jgi:hypothetical protein